jgi:PIN domain nuclease of toxin-antitoxin system
LGAIRYVDGLIHDAVSRRRPICFDSPALIPYVSGRQPYASLVAPMIEHTELAVVISAVTLAEILTPPESQTDRRVIEAVRRFVLAIPRLTVVDLDQSVAVEVAIVRAETGLKLPDAAAIATGRLTNSFAIVGNDRRWKNKPLGVPYHHMDDILAIS